jgi:hypothetical protein
VGLHPRACVRPEPPGVHGILEQPQQRVGEDVFVLGRDHQSGLPLAYDLGQPSHAGDHPRELVRHRLGDRQPVGLVPRRQAEDAGLPVELGQPLAVGDEADDLHPGLGGVAVGPLHGTHDPPLPVCGSDQWVCGYMEGAVRTERGAARELLRNG